MTKTEFGALLRQKLSGLPQEDIEKSVAYYDEMIDDRMEDGLCEEEAVAAVGPADRIAAEILADTPLPKLIREKVAPRRALRGWEIALLIVGSPLWLPLLIAAAAVILAVYIVLWAVVVSLFAVVVAFAVTDVAAFAAVLVSLFGADLLQGAFFAGLGLVFAGLTVLMFLGSLQAAKGAVFLGKKRCSA